jgi:hypothetical protein
MSITAIVGNDTIKLPVCVSDGTPVEIPMKPARRSRGRFSMRCAM